MAGQRYEQAHVEAGGGRVDPLDGQLVVVLYRRPHVLEERASTSKGSASGSRSSRPSASS